ncbi:MAG: glycosyltransferase [Actinomycetia bacterium]|nr:glycosyltransferase [Actinomycetes bacterium]
MLTDRATKLLGMPQPSQDYPDGLAVTVLIPAHNEEATIEPAIGSLWSQERRPDQIVVVADNCSDRTVELALGAGALVMETTENSEKKPAA